MPGLLIFIVSILVVYFLAPHATPMIAAILSIVFLLYGVYDHRRLFASEYQLSTWQEQLKIYSPALMIIAIILFIIYSMLSFFTGGVVPIPSMPNIEIPSVNSITNSVMESVNNVSNSIQNASMNLLNSTKSTNSTNSTNKSTNNNSFGLGSFNNNNNNKNKNKNKNSTSRSIFETV